MTTEHDFDSRATYLSYRADWRIRYAAASDGVRAARRFLQEGHADGIDVDAAALRQSALHRRRRDASLLMKELARAKERRDRILDERRLAA